MKAIADETRMTPETRIRRLNIFNQRLKSCKESATLLKTWQLGISDQIVEVPARILTGENILFGNNRIFNCNQNADWSREFRKTSLFMSVTLERWYCVMPERLARETEKFIEMCINVSRDMNIKISKPNL